MISSKDQNLVETHSKDVKVDKMPNKEFKRMNFEKLKRSKCIQIVKRNADSNEKILERF